MSHHHPQQLQAWLARCRNNLAQFRQNRHALSEEEQIKFIQNQYLILQTAMRVVKGHARFEGV
jgi:hypothetical protein